MLELLRDDGQHLKRPRAAQRGRRGRAHTLPSKPYLLSRRKCGGKLGSQRVYACDLQRGNSRAPFQMERRGETWSTYFGNHLGTLLSDPDAQEVGSEGTLIKNCILTQLSLTDRKTTKQASQHRTIKGCLEHSNKTFSAKYTHTAELRTRVQDEPSRKQLTQLCRGKKPFQNTLHIHGSDNRHI